MVKFEVTGGYVKVLIVWGMVRLGLGVGWFRVRVGVVMVWVWAGLG